MTRIESKTVTVNKSAEELFEQLKDLRNFKRVMPDSVDKFEADEDSFLFGMKGMPDVRLRVEEKREPEYIRFKSASSKIDFSLEGHVKPVTANTCEVRFEFSGKFNPMVRMMVERPLKNFIENLVDKMKDF